MSPAILIAGYTIFAVRLETTGREENGCTVIRAFIGMLFTDAERLGTTDNTVNISPSYATVKGQYDD